MQMHSFYAEKSFVILSAHDSEIQNHVQSGSCGSLWTLCQQILGGDDHCHYNKPDDIR